MKQRAAAGVLLILAIFLFCGQTGVKKAERGMRIEAPERAALGSRYYYDPDINPFFPELAPYYKVKAGYITGNCTWYAWGRACEIAGKTLPYVFTGDAAGWWEINKKEGWYPYGTSPKRGAIVCYKTHAAVVEQTDPLIVSESGWTVETKKTPIVFHCGKPWRSREEPMGYIYVNNLD